MRWIRHTALAAAAVLALSACAGSGTEIGTQPDEPAPTTAAPSTTTPATTQPPGTQPAGNGSDQTTSTIPPDPDPAPQVEGPAAPDFAFALADGSTFTLSGEQKPVYLVFWAEW